MAIGNQSADDQRGRHVKVLQGNGLACGQTVRGGKRARKSACAGEEEDEEEAHGM
ncbi:hypothetical protein [Dyadobacter sp. 50-39]|uniref:hypothetical protein n=1 Tax=Dyadobacter sp. 50-39 TaxID=1895756 RepID=UPI0025C4DC28|nr:hypothetical protein [Dyadobacter sp. 50-39]